LSSKLDEALADHFGQRVGDGAAQDVTAADEVHVRVVRDLEDVLRAAQPGDGRGCLLEQLAQAPELGHALLAPQHGRRHFVALIEQAAHAAFGIAQRREAVVPPGVARHSAADHRQVLLVERDAFAGGHDRLELRADHVPDVRPQLGRRLAERSGVPLGGDLGPGVVVEREEPLPPVDGRREARIQADAHRHLQGGRPCLRRAERMARPVERADARAHVVAALQEGE
jgi:hypothetical protein